MKTVYIATALASLLPLAAHAETAEPRWKSAMVSGSSRLAVYSIMQERPAGSRKFVDSFMLRDGLFHRSGEGPQRISRHLSVTPLVEHDNNVNGGIPSDTVRLAGIDFIVNEDDRAKEGFLLGAQVSAGTDYSIANGRVLSFGATAAYQHSFEHDIGKKFIGGSACMKSHVQQWTWVDSCAGFRLLEQGSEVEEAYVSSAATHVFSSNIADHAFELKVEQAYREDYDKLTVGGTLISAIPEVGALRAGLKLGEEIEGEHTTLYDASLALTRPVFGYLTTAAISHRYAAGSMFFGEDREDETTRVSLSVDVTERFSVSLGYEVTDSTADLYDDDSISLGVDIRSWQF
jgi:hypothetical protein